MKVININQKFNSFSEQWSPRIIAASNGQLIKLARIQGEFVWHSHDGEDEVFIVYKGTLFIDLKPETSLELREGEMAVVPKGTSHRTRSGDEETWIMLIEPASTRHTGNEIFEITSNEQPWI